MKPKRTISFIVVLAIAVAANSVCNADIITLQDGTVHEGEVLKESAESVTLRIRMGSNAGSIVIPRREIAAIRFKAIAPDTVLAEGVTLQKKAEALETEPKKAAEAWMKAGEFYQSHPGYSNLARAAFIKVLTFEPDYALARARLGYEKTAKGWAEIPRPKPREEPALAAASVAVAPENEMIIGLRRDEALMKRILNEQAARQRQDAEAERRQAAEARPPFTAYGYSRDYLYIGPYGNTYYVPASTMFGYTDHFYPVRGSCFGDYGYSSSGLGIGFSGRIGSIRVNGSYFGGNCGYSSGGGFTGGGFRGRFGF